MIRLTLIVLATVLAILSAGCGPQAKLVLIQPNAPQAQQVLRLTSDWAFSDTADGRQQLLLDFPLPQSVAGPRDFRVFLAVPERAGVTTIDLEHLDAARGFLIQEVGRLRGKTVFSGGTVELKAPSLGSSEWTVIVDVHCEDGTRVVGKAKLRPEKQELNTFRTAHAADIQLLSPQSQPTEESPTGTLPRQSAKP